MIFILLVIGHVFNVHVFFERKNIVNRLLEIIEYRRSMSQYLECLEPHSSGFNLSVQMYPINFGCSSDSDTHWLKMQPWRFLVVDDIKFQLNRYLEVISNSHKPSHLLFLIQCTQYFDLFQNIGCKIEIELSPYNLLVQKVC